LHNILGKVVSELREFTKEVVGLLIAFTASMDKDKATGVDKSQSAPKKRTESKSTPIPAEIAKLTSGPHARHNHKLFSRLQQLVSSGDPQATYKSTKEIGEGGFGKVYKGIQRNGGQEVAIKVMNLVVERNGASYIPPFLYREIENMRKLPHENIVQYMDSYLVKREIWLVMEYIDGIDLRNASLACDMYSSEIDAVFYNVLKALDYIHSMGLMHKDVKSENILLSKQGEVKLADFGLSQRMSDNMINGLSTPFIMAPDLAKGGAYNSKVDIWALGIMLYECFYCVAPYEGEIDEKKVKKTYSEEGKAREP
jgi:p21-activated kinase 1